MPGRNAPHSATIASTLSRIIWISRATGSSWKGPLVPIPASLTSRSTTCPRAATSAGIRSRSDASVRSTAIHSTRTPCSPPISAAMSRRRSARRATRVSAWPRRASSPASATPMPDDAPVTSAVVAVLTGAELTPPPPATSPCTHSLDRNPSHCNPAVRAESRCATVAACSASTTCPTARSPAPAASRELVTRLGDHAVPLAPFEREAGLPEGTLAGPVLNPLLALGPDAWAALRGTLQQRLQDPPELIPLAEHRAAAAAGDRRLRRLLLVARAREQPRAHLPARLRAAAAELARAAGRLPRPRRLGRGVRHAGPPPARPAAPPTAAPPSAPAGGSTSSSSSASSPARPAPGSRPRRPPTTSSASCSSTTGARATSSAGSTCRSARSWASRSRPRSRPGSPRWRRSSPTACPPRRRNPSRSSTCAPTATGRSTSSSRSS